jgi:serine/threonine-protein kinase
VTEEREDGAARGGEAGPAEGARAREHVLEPDPDPDSDSDPADPELDELLRAIASAPPVDPATLSPPSETASLVGERLGQFRIEARLGAGGMGVVYRAVDERLQRRVALKVLRRPARGGLDLVAEARAAAAVTHANLAAIYEVGEAKGVAYIAMELVDGVTLRAHLRAGRPPEAEALRIAREIARGLARAHREGIVHRDLKPENVMIAGDGAVKILDFGIAGVAEPDVTEGASEARPEATRSSRRIAGTPAYMAPEQGRGARLDARADVFAFGVMLVELLTGAAPTAARGDAPSRAARAKLLAALPAAQRALVEGCVSEDPSLRPADGAALERALLALATTAAPGRGPRDAALARMLVALLALLALLALVITGGLAARERSRPIVVAPPPAASSARGAGVALPAALPVAPRPLKRLTANVPENDVTHAALSPDGGSLAYIDKGGLAIAKLGTVELRRVALDAKLAPELVAWMPDGRSVLVSASQAGKSARELWLAEASGPRRRRLAEGEFTGIAPSPDGKTIAYAESDRVGVMPLLADGATGATSAKTLAGAADRRALVGHREGCNISEIAWSPDAQRLAFASLCFDSLAATTIESVAVSGGHEPVVAVRDARLFNDYAHAGLLWLPGGELVFPLAEWLPAESGANLWSVRLDGATGRALEPPRQRTRWIGTSAWHLSADRDGKRIAFLRFETQTDVFVGGLADRDHRLAAPRRLTLSERNERPSGWTADGREVLFFSDRAGNFDLFRQPLDAILASPIASTEAWETMAQLTPDGASALFWRFPPVSPGEAVRPDLFRAPLTAGGGAEGVAGVRVLSALATSLVGAAGRPQPWEMRVRCPRRGGARASCVLSEKLGDELVFTRLDPEKGRGDAVLRLPKPSAAAFLWELSPDGATIAIPTVNGPVQLWSIGGPPTALPTAPSRSLDVLAGCDPITASWNATGTGLFVTVECEADSRFEIDFRGLDEPPGSARRLWCASPSLVLETVASPDGKHLAIAVKSYDDDVWMIDGL